jgi:hemerythrin-like domain-containing protein
MRLTPISGNPGDGETPRSPVELLLDCHARIRHFVQLSLTLAAAGDDVPDAEIADAAAAIFRYFSLALPLHEADEDITLFPRICAIEPKSGLLRQAAATMVEQHRAINELVAELLPICSMLDRSPLRLSALASRLEHVTTALEQIFAAHLHLEETIVFPALAKLFTAEEKGEMLREMEERRKLPRRPTDSRSIHLIR